MKLEYRLQIDTNLRRTPLSTGLGTDFCTENRRIFFSVFKNPPLQNNRDL